MAILLTNGKRYINYNSNGGVIKVLDISQAHDFRTVEKAIKQKEKAPGKCAGFYYVEVDSMGVEPDASETKSGSEKEDKTKRKKFSVRERLAIYRKTKGRCYLCGEFVDFDSFEIEHRMPVSKGGANDLVNLFCSCHCCNFIKNDMTYQELTDKISSIFMYQMRKKYHNGIKWKLIETLMNGGIRV